MTATFKIDLAITVEIFPKYLGADYVLDNADFKHLRITHFQKNLIVFKAGFIGTVDEYGELDRVSDVESISEARELHELLDEGEITHIMRIPHYLPEDLAFTLNTVRSVFLW